MSARLLLVALLLVSAGVSAQESLRGRWSCRGSGCATAVAPAITITTPTTGQAHQTGTASLVLGGTARNDVTRVEWSNDRGGSGIASGTGNWTVVGSSEPETVFEDTFTVDAATNLVDHTPGPVGLSWAEVEDTSGTNYAKINVAGDYVSPALTESTQKLIVIATPASAVSGTHYTLSAKTGPNYSVSSGTDSALIFGYQNTSNYCALILRSSVQNPDLYLMKRVAGVNSDIGTGANVTPLANQTFSVEINGTSLVAKQNGTAVITATDTGGFCTSVSTTVGIGWGDIRITGRTINQVATFDDFKVVDEDGSASGITLQSGANVITATAYCGVSVCGSDSITVTLGVSDTTAPQVTITGPTTGTTYATSTAAITLDGTATDNIGVSSVTWTCATCTPASGTATGTNTWTFNATLAVGANTIIVTATDAATNSDTDQLVATYTAADVTAPTITITSPTAGATYSSSSTPLTVGGTASDNVAVTSVSCANSGGGGTIAASGTVNWTCSMPLFNGEQTITVTAADQATNSGTDSFVVTYAPPLTIVSPAGLPAASQNVAYSVTLSASNGLLARPVGGG